MVPRGGRSVIREASDARTRGRRARARGRDAHVRRGARRGTPGHTHASREVGPWARNRRRRQVTTRGVPGVRRDGGSGFPHLFLSVGGRVCVGRPLSGRTTDVPVSARKVCGCRFSTKRSRHSHRRPPRVSTIRGFPYQKWGQSGPRVSTPRMRAKVTNHRPDLSVLEVFRVKGVDVFPSFRRGVEKWSRHPPSLLGPVLR